MPYVVEKDTEACSTDKPWAVKKKDSDKVFGCHATKSDAEKQQSALYANTEASAMSAAAAEVLHLRVVSEPVLAAAQLEVEDAGDVNESDIHVVTVKNVPLMSVGMKFPASTGPVTFDFGDLASAVQASNDPTIPRPRVKLGHTDPRFNDCPCPVCGSWIEWGLWINNENVFDAMPNFGFVENMTLQNGGAWIYADLTSVPKWLADVMPVAFPSRSIEGWFAYKGINGKEYKFIITDLALLGVVFPGVMNLADLPSLYGDEQPETVQFEEAAA